MKIVDLKCRACGGYIRTIEDWSDRREDYEDHYDLVDCIIEIRSRIEAIEKAKVTT